MLARSSALPSCVIRCIVFWLLHISPSATGQDAMKYSVIVVRQNLHNSNLFADRDRLNAYTEGEVNVQFANSRQLSVFDPTRGSPFGVGHPQGMDKRIRIIHTWDLLGNHNTIPDIPDLGEIKMSHLKGACEDISETTILRVKHDKPAEFRVIWQTPSACWSNIVVTYPYNALPGVIMDQQLKSFHQDLRLAFIPLGVMDGFPFVQSYRRRPAASRNMFANLVGRSEIWWCPCVRMGARAFKARTDTSGRRVDLLNILRDYEVHHPELKMIVGPPRMNSSSFQDLLLDSQFTIAPRGLHPETFRMHEALEAGSIPIISKADFLEREDTTSHERDTDTGDAAWNTVAASPFARAVSVESWHQLPELLDRMSREDPEVIAKLQEDCIRWYEELMHRTYTSLLHFGNGQEFFPQNGPIVLAGFDADVKE